MTYNDITVINARDETTLCCSTVVTSNSAAEIEKNEQQKIFLVHHRNCLPMLNLSIEFQMQRYTYSFFLMKGPATSPASIQ
jgi:hypothetical protein